jgi:hypothetical protein
MGLTCDSNDSPIVTDQMQEGAVSFRKRDPLSPSVTSVPSVVNATSVLSSFPFSVLLFHL